LDWAPWKKKPKVGVSRNKCSHKQALCIFKCLPFVEEKFLHVTCPSTALQMLAQVFMVFNPCKFLMASCANKIALKNKKIENNPMVCFFSLHILKYLVLCTNKIISCTYNVNFAN
jgi:hypothetical protein